MRVIFQLAFFLLLCLFSEGLAAYLPFPFPGAVLAMLLLFLLLLFKWLKAEQLEESGDFLRKHMGLFFVPPSVGVIDSLGLLKRELLPFLLICLLGMLVTFLTSALLSSFLMRLQDGRENKRRSLSGGEKL